jgi:hypothetical protein
MVAGPQAIEWRRRFPTRSLIALARYATFAAVLIGAAAVLFGDEPTRLDSGAANPLAHILLWTVVILSVGAIPVLLAVVRRPRVAANYYALTVRPGWIRSLVLPWARVAEVAVADDFLLVRCYSAAERPSVGSMGNSPHWVDQTVLRSLARQGSRVSRHFDLALRMRDFAAGTDAAQLDLVALAAFAPDHVLIAVPETGHVLGRKKNAS